MQRFLVILALLALGLVGCAQAQPAYDAAGHATDVCPHQVGGERSPEECTAYMQSHGIVVATPSSR